MGMLRYRPEIDGLRAVAVLAVFVFHLNSSLLPGGFVGVDVFFVLSGYLISGILWASLQDGTFSLAVFWQRRIARIFPAFFVVAAATTAAAAHFYLPQDFASVGANLAAAALSLANVKQLLQGNYFQASPDSQPFLHYWSLAVEEQFYLAFPLVLLAVRRRAALPLSVCALVSLVACIIVTARHPVAAFYLLPTRAWELLAGAVLAISGARGGPMLAQAGALLIAGSIAFIHENAGFPGWVAMLPVAGTLAICAAQGGAVLAALSSRAAVTIGKLSYSLYLWHWPVFSIVDYRLYSADEITRAALKITITAVLAAATYALVERPARALLNAQRRVAFAGMAAAVCAAVTIGLMVRNTNYLNVEPEQVAAGGIRFEGQPGRPSIVLMGDSHASMYATELKALCARHGCDLRIISVAGGDPLPKPGTTNPLWDDSLAVVMRTHPTHLVLACNWTTRLSGQRERITQALQALGPNVGSVIVLDQPPAIPADATRERVRMGSRPPYREPPEHRAKREELNAYLHSLEGNGVRVVSVAQHFVKSDGELVLTDPRGRQLYQDFDHLSPYGVSLVGEDLAAWLTR